MPEAYGTIPGVYGPEFGDDMPQITTDTEQQLGFVEPLPLMHNPVVAGTSIPAELLGLGSAYGATCLGDPSA